MTYTEQIEQYVGYYPQTAKAILPASCGVTSLSAFPHVVVQIWDDEYCELEDAGGNEIARFRLVG